MDRVSMARLRVRFYSFAALAAVGIVIDAPIWSIAAAAFLCAAIPLAVALQGTGRVRALFVPSRVAKLAAPQREVVRDAQVR
ncbi:hypothetical protein JMF97_17680 [Micromonospora fiedleri]|uniref:Uncharacterized protein n=1 Tax=Micromonospora fiedleri TaxID=1157498 RepID=A0ABS1UQ50_9ACTN|nr:MULTISPECIES: hypothetical protein [Micromonospora]MBL6277989.1 hypothetical protein [Micromonospora fiedleri]WSK41099.1 hypothetical protein OG712_21625 [Micromonospora maris]